MIYTYIKIAYRSLMKNRLVSFINVFGLGLAMSVGMIVLVTYQDEIGYDRFHPHPDRTYRIISTYQKNDGSRWSMASTPLPLRAALDGGSGDIEQTVSLYPALSGTARIGGRELNLNGAFTEPSFFRVFGFTLAEGDTATAFRQPNDIVLSGEAARRFFGPAPALGKVLDLGNKGSFIVTGVLNEPPGKSHISFDAYAPFTAVPGLVQSKVLPEKSNDWGDCMITYTYVTLKTGTGTRNLSDRLAAMAVAINKTDKQGRLGFKLQSLTRIRPADDKIYNDIGGGTTWNKLWVEIDVALLILLAAAFNYTNLTVARALTRAKEVGIRKIAGAKRRQVFVQYIVEACVLAFCALGFAWVLLELIVRWAPFNDGYEMVPSNFDYPLPFVLDSFAFALFTGLLAGAAPAWILSSFKPLRVLKNLSTAKVFGSVGLQKTLTVFQYTLSLVIVIFLFTFYRQFSFLAAQDQGFNRENTMVVPLNGADAHVAAAAVAGISGVGSVAAMSNAFTSHFSGISGAAWVDQAQKNAVSLDYYFTDPAFVPSMKIRLLTGRNFGPRADSLPEHDVLLNETAVRQLGFTSDEQALGRWLWVSDSIKLNIIGVVADFHFEIAGKPMTALALRYNPKYFSYLYVGVEPGDKTALSDRLRQQWLRLFPATPFTYSWLDEDIERRDSQSATISLLGYLAFMTVTIATLGLLGLVTYNVETRRKEIGVRKVIGATNGQLVRLLSVRYVKLLVIAGCIGVPIGFILGSLFQQNFPVRPGGGGPAAMGCFVLLLGIGLVTIISQTFRAARENPASSLKTE